MRILIGSVAAILITTSASAQTMNAEAFHQRATKLQNKGALAIFSRGEIKALMGEVRAASQRAREQRLAAAKAGRKPRYCPPEGPQSIGSDEFMSSLGAIPATERSKIDMTEATIRILARQFPCPAG